jgi:hypothetical protein
VQALVSGDVNKDGIDDVVLGEGSGQRVLLGTPSGLFTLGPLAPVSGAAATPRAFAPGDVNGDGHLDLVSAHPGPASSTVMLQLGDGTGAFPGTTAIPLPASSGTVVSLVLADLNGDEALDLVLGVDAMGGGHLIVQPNVLGSFVGPGMTLVTGSNPDGVALSSTAGTNHLVAASLAGGDVTIFRNITPQVVLTGPPVAGATFTLNLLAEDSGTLAYLSGFASTTVPGIPLSDGRTIPLTLDPLLFWCLDPVNTAITGGAGSLDATGGAEIHFSIPRISELRGLTMHAAFIVLDNGAPLGIHRISAPRPIVIQ